MLIDSDVGIVNAEIETPLFTGNSGFWARLSEELRHSDQAGRVCYQKNSEIRYPPRSFDGSHVCFSPVALEQSQPEHIMGLDIADRIVSKFELETGSKLTGNIGVFIAQAESSHRIVNSDVNGQFAMGNSRAVVANRISHRFGWTGPSLSVDTACSSGLYALHIAAQEIRTGNCEAALVIGISHFYDSATGDSLRAAQLLSPSGSLNAFHTSRDGYVRSEGVAGVLLVSSSFAKRHKLSPYLNIKATVVNQNSNAQHFSIPDISTQESLYLEALTRASWNASDIDHIEMHATGTLAGDKSELSGILNVFGKGDRRSLLTLGAVKTNIGHLEGASALASIVKLVLSMAKGELPPTIVHDEVLHVSSANMIEIQKHAVPLLSDKSIKLGVSSFGFGGSNAFLLLEGYPENNKQNCSMDRSHKEFSFPRLEQGSNEFFDLDLRDTIAITSHRSDVIISAGVALSKSRGTGGTNYSLNKSFNCIATTNRRRKALFCFGGQSNPINSHHRIYYETCKIYRDTIERLAQKFASYLHWDLIEHYFVSHPTKPGLFDQVFVFSHQLAMAYLLRSYGCVPSAVLGYSVGEFVAYVVADGMSEDMAVRLLSFRTQAMLEMSSCRPAGQMIEALGDYVDIAALLEVLDEKQIGAKISAGKVILSGYEDQILDKLNEFRGLTYRKLRVADAFHSILMLPAMEIFENNTAKVECSEFRTFSIPVFSTITGEQLDKPNRPLFVNQIIDTVEFGSAFSAAKEADDEYTPIDLSCNGQIVSYSPHLCDSVVPVSQLITPKSASYEEVEAALIREGFIELNLPAKQDYSSRDLIFAPILPLWVPSNEPDIYATLTAESQFVKTDDTFNKDQLYVFESLMKKVLQHYNHKIDSDKKWFEILSDSFHLTMIIYEMNTAFRANYNISSVMTQFGTPSAFFKGLISDKTEKCDSSTLPIDKTIELKSFQQINKETIHSNKETIHSDVIVPIEYVNVTNTSRKANEDAREHLANPRSKAGYFYRYPIIAGNRGLTRLLDSDGNELIDLAMGFGTLFLGHKNKVLLNSISEFVSDGPSIGPENAFSAEAARLLCNQTGYDRVAFTTTGTEAVMVALRLARSYTGRSKVVIFQESYHGHYDGVLGLDAFDGGRSIPAASGISVGAVSELLVFAYGDINALREIEAQSDTIAAIMIEPVQSSNLNIPDAEYLKSIRSFCDINNIVLIFDEILTGFRCGLRGAQDVFGVRPDIALFGKMIGNGLPIAAIAGNKSILSHVDGGMKQLLDENEKLPTTTYLLGTFNKNGMSILAMRDVMRELLNNPQLIDQAQNKVIELSKKFRDQCPPELRDLLIIRRFGSVFRFQTKQQPQLFHKYMIRHGVYIFEAGTCFMSPAHSDGDLDLIVKTMIASLHSMIADNVLEIDRDNYTDNDIFSALHSNAIASSTKRTVAMSDIQFGILKECVVNPLGNKANTIGFALMLQPNIDEQFFLDRFREMIKDHQAFKLRLLSPPSSRDKWKYRKFAIEQASFIIDSDLTWEDWLSTSTTTLSAQEYYSRISSFGFSLELGLFGVPLFNVEVKNCRDKGKVLSFSFHHIAFDGETVAEIRSILTAETKIDDSMMLSFSDLNIKAHQHRVRMHEIEISEILKYSISKSNSEYEKSAQLYQAYESFQFIVPSNFVSHVKKKFSMNANMVAFSLFSIALGRYFETDKVMINCTEDGRSCEGSHLQGFGMLARYFPCSVDLPTFELNTETASSIIDAYWNGFNRDFSSYLSKLQCLGSTNESSQFKFSYNYDSFIEKPNVNAAGVGHKSTSIYPRVGIFDIVVNVCNTCCDSSDNLGLLFKVDYSAVSIDKDKLKNVFSY
ncbi:aminotransferase class III-fold pyridoxal phosphate-dependent enzyme [Vibrio sp.]|nr:aminotransferase class III-fold pyridoxal phosphate-dependent enzyme [Vibrio sp.]